MRAVKERTSTADVAGVAITHGNRPIWAGTSKFELARYYQAAGNWLMPHLLRRPLTLVRCPDGTQGDCFFQRHLLMAASPGDVQAYKRERGSRAPYMYVQSIDQVISTVQNGAVEFHTSGATIPDIAHPDRFTLDLDPGPGVTWKTLVEAATLTRELLDTLSLKSFVKTTGGNGLHIVVPIKPEADWPEIMTFTRDIAHLLSKTRSELFLATMSKAQRIGKIFVDYLRNSGEIRTAVAAYSARTHSGATVSVPIAWAELDHTDIRNSFTVKNVLRRLAKQRTDPWARYWTTQQQITDTMRQAVRAV